MRENVCGLLNFLGAHLNRRDAMNAEILLGVFSAFIASLRSNGPSIWAAARLRWEID